MDRKILEKYLNGEATEEERLQVLHWAEENEDNRKELLACRSLCNALFFNEEVHPRRNSGKTSRASVFIRRLAMAAGTAAAVAVGVFFAVTARTDIQLAVETLTAPAGTITESILSDSTRVCLNSGSTIEILSWKKERRVRLDGEAYFDVAKDGSRPFIVETGNMDVKVLGTEFNVNGKESTVVLVRGSVSVASRAGDNGEFSYRLVPGQKFTRNPENGSGTIAEVDTDDYTSWTNGYLKFDRLPVCRVIEKIGEYYNVSIDTSALDGLDACPISGKLDLRVRVDTALVNLEFLAPVSFEKISDSEYRLTVKQ